MIIKRFSFIARRTAALLLFLLNLIVIGFLVWASDKGFDITDEGFYLLASQFPMDVSMWTGMFYLYTSGLYSIAGHSVIILRLFGIVLMIGSSAILFYGLYRLLRQIGFKLFDDLDVIITSWSLVSFGAMLYYVLLVLTPSYNLINSAALNAASGFLLLGLALSETNEDKHKLSIAAFLGAGLCIGVSFFVKFTSGISLFILFSCVLAFWPCQRSLVRFKNIFMVGFGSIVWILIHFWFIQSPVSWWHIFQGGVNFALLMGAGHGLTGLHRYYLECSVVAKNAFLTFWKFYIAIFLGAGVLLLLRRIGKDWFYAPSVLLLILFAAMGRKSYLLGFHRGGTPYAGGLSFYYLAWLLLFLSAVIVTLFYQRMSDDRWWTETRGRFLLVGLLLLFLPVAGAIGTANPITVNIIFYVAPLFVLYLLLLLILSWSNDNKWILICGTSIIVTFTFAQVIVGGSMFPYRLNTDIMAQTIPTDIGMSPTQLKLDVSTSVFFGQMHKAAYDNGFKPGDDVLAFCNMPGVVFSLGGRSPSIPWFNSGYKGSRAANEMALSFVPKERIKDAFILQNVDGAGGFPDLAKFGIDFPGNYTLCGEAIWPATKDSKDLVRLWKPKRI